MPPIPVLSPEQSAEWDRLAEADGIGLATLMESAGRGCAGVIAARYPEAVRSGVLIAAGTGNNGGDGWVLARALHRHDLPVWVAPLPAAGAGVPARMAARARSEGVRVVAPDGPWPAVALLVDAILGTGARGAPRQPAAALIERMNDLALPIVAIDGPSGVDLQSGTTAGSAIHAALSITFNGLRRGHLLARDDVGDVVLVDIGLPPPRPEWPLLVTDPLAAGWLVQLQARDHKGDRGRVVVVGGESGMTGAVRMAARAAFGAGAGLVFAVTPPGSVQILATAEPDLQTRAHVFEQPPRSDLLDLIGHADSVVIGPGLGRAPGRVESLVALLGPARHVVLDADGLHAFQGKVGVLRGLARDRRIVLTPHPGEFRTLFPDHASSMETDPWAAAGAAAESSECCVLLKGVPSVAAASGKPALTVAAGNPGLATGGSGDLLSGFVGTALAHGLQPMVAAGLAAQILGRAADLAARRTTARGLRPMDVLAALPDLWRSWDALRQARPAPRPPILFELESPQKT